LRAFLSLFPTRRQWNGWSLPSKLTAIGTYIAVLTLIFAILNFFIGLYLTRDNPRIDFRTFNDLPMGLVVDSDISSTEFQLIVARYPYVSGLRSADFSQYVNSRIEQVAFGGVERRDLLEHRSEWEVGTANATLLSLASHNRTYYRGRANFPFIYRSLNFDVRNGVEVKASDLFLPSARRFFERYTYDFLTDRDIGAFIDPDSIHPNYFPNLSEIDFLISNDEIVLLFSSYQVTAGSVGSVRIPIKLERLAHLFVRGSVLESYYRSIRG